jgi:hypothetical protein
MPHPTHEYSPYSTPLSSPTWIPERRPLFAGTAVLSPPSTPGLFSSHSQDTLRDEYLSGRPTSLGGIGKTGPLSGDRYFETSSRLQEDHQEPERSRLVGNRPISFSRMDMEVQRLKEKDTKLKRNIRRFRFVVRSAHLACRFVSLQLVPLPL